MARIDEREIKKKVLIGPVRDRSKEEKKFINKRAKETASKGIIYYDPYYDDFQPDKIGLSICHQMRGGLLTATETIDVYVNPNSVGSAVDIGIVVINNMDIEIINKENLPSYDEASEYVRFLYDYENKNPANTNFHKKVLERKDIILNNDIILFDWHDSYNKNKDFLITFGMAFGYGRKENPSKEILVENPENIKLDSHKSYKNALVTLSQINRKTLSRVYSEILEQKNIYKVPFV